MSDTRAIARRAGELIGEHGWIRGRFGNPNIGFCLLGACLRAYADLGQPQIGVIPISAELYQAINPAVPLATLDALLASTLEIESRLMAWNDKEGRTRQDVLDLLDRIARS